VELEALRFVRHRASDESFEPGMGRPVIIKIYQLLNDCSTWTSDTNLIRHLPPW
jgi:hypothetical protein